MAFLRNSFSRSARMATIRYKKYSTNAPIIFSEEVLQAKSENKPIVALESTIITHGMPYPQNLSMALEVEKIIKERGATPATIAILKGQLTVGLTKHQLEYLAQAKGVVKASRRDLAVIMAAKLDGATTVAGTIIAAELANIPVFVTGGLGGVHREGESTLDVSADLTELGRSKTLVVCSGVKSILDISRTLEYLETQGVCVCAFGPTHDFPAFYTPRSGHRAPYRVADAAEAARVLQASQELGLESGIVIAVPVPDEQAMDESVIEKAIEAALAEAKNKGIRGKEVTPHILNAVAKVTDGASLKTNIALIKNNARVGADIAVQHKKLKNNDTSGISKGKSPFFNPVRQLHSCASAEGRDFAAIAKNSKFEKILVIGGSNVDTIYKLTEESVKLDGSTHACSTARYGGGVGRNMAEALWRLSRGRASLLTAVGDDVEGRFVRDIAPGLVLDGCTIKGGRTSSYATLLDAKGECQLGLGDMALHEHISIDLVNQHLDVLSKAPVVVLDGNVPQPTIDHVLNICSDLQKPVFFEPTDRRKAVKVLHGNHKIAFASPNVHELQAMAEHLDLGFTQKSDFDLQAIKKMCEVVSQSVQTMIVTLGARGVLVVKVENAKLTSQLYNVERINSIENVSGAGDCFASGFLYGNLIGIEEPYCVSLGFEAAKKALLSKSLVPEVMNISNLQCAESITI